MTRRRQNIRLLIVVVVLLVIIAVALFAKFQNGNALFDKLYEFIRDTSLLIATIAVAYLANIYQRRQQFLMSLREQWREIVQRKALFCFIAKLRALPMSNISGPQPNSRNA